jgi:hypothetical protein
MGRAARVHVNHRSRFRESPRSTGMIEMNVTEKNVPHVFLREAGFAKIDNHIVESRLRPSVEQRDALIGLESGRGNNSGVPKLSRI